MAKGSRRERKNLLDQILEAFGDEPCTPGEIARKLKISQKTVQTKLLDLATTSDRVRVKKIGRYRVFWKP